MAMPGDVRASFNMESFSGILLATILLCAALLDIRLLYRDVRSGVLSLTKSVHANPLLLQFSHALVTRGPSGVRKWIDAFELLMREIVKVVQDFRSGAYYNPFGRKHPIIIRSPDAMQELSEAPALSQRAVYADIFGFKYNMGHREIDYDPHEQVNMRYRLFSRAIRVNGLAQMNVLQPYLQARLERTFAEEINPQDSNGKTAYPRFIYWVPVQIAPLMRKVATGMLGVYFFGNKLSEELVFSAAMRRWYNDVMTCMKALQVVPSFMKSCVHSIITNNNNALDVLFARLQLAMDSTQDGWEEEERLKSVTLLHNLSEASKDSNYWTHTAVIQAIIGIWFAASHQPWTNLHFILLELCARPEYIQLIRSEIQSKGNLDYESINELPMLDSFIKEAVRFNASDKMGIRRKALKDYTFSNGGQHVSVGEIACVPSWEITHDESKYPNPYEFDGLRFVKRMAFPEQPKNVMRGTTFTDGTKDWPIWGLGSKICPGRWHAALVIKMVLAYLILKYDFRLQDESKSHKWFWETFQMPYESTKVLLRKRQHGEGATI